MRIVSFIIVVVGFIAFFRQDYAEATFFMATAIWLNQMDKQ